MWFLFLVSNPLTVSTPFSYPLQNSFPACCWHPGLTRSMGLHVDLAGSGAKFGSNSTWTFKPNPHRQVTDSCPYAPILNSSVRDLSPAQVSCHLHPISCAWANWGRSCHGLRELFLGEEEGKFSKDSEESEWIGLQVVSTVFTKEVDSVFLVYLRYTNNWTRRSNNKWLAFSLWFT